MKILLFILTILFISCQEEITINLPNNAERLVVEGSIEKNCPPYVIITKNQAYFDPVNENTYDNLFDIEVDSITIWFNDLNGNKISKNLIRIENLSLSSNFNESVPPVYLPEDFTFPYDFSKEGRTYFLEIIVNNDTITSQTTIPYSTPLDCVWIERNEVAIKDWKCDIRAMYSDPADDQNNLLIRSKRTIHYERDSIYNDGYIDDNDLTHLLVDAGPDVLFNGETFETYFPRPKDGASFPFGAYNADHFKPFYNDGILDSIFIPHDEVLIKFCQIDEPSMKFWRALVRQAGTNGNPFAEPINLVSNVNGALGVFTGYGSVYYKIPIIKNYSTDIEHDPTLLDIF